jgi:endonuclease/exonuclease/phosphatase family metal-dependent hydrolase
MELRILTINTWKGDGAYQARMALLKKQLLDLAPDVILMQEVLRPIDPQAAYDTLQAISEVLAGESAFVPMRRNKRQVEGQVVDCWSGMGCWSRFPIEAAAGIELPSNDTDGGRAGQMIRIQIHGQHFLFANVHLSFLRDSDALKIAQLETILQEMMKQTGLKAYFIAGDFNSVPNSKTIQYLQNHPHFRAKDVFLSGNSSSENGFTMPLATHPELGTRIDYIFSLATAEVPHLPIMRSAVTLNQAEEGLYPSDHFGVIAQVEFQDAIQ